MSIDADEMSLKKKVNLSRLNLDVRVFPWWRVDYVRLLQCLMKARFHVEQLEQGNVILNKKNKNR